MQADSGCGYFKEKSTGFPQIPQTVWVAYIFFLLIRNCCWCEPLRSGLGIGIVYLRATQKAPHRSAFCENIIRSFVKVGADVELARSRPAFLPLPAQPLRLGPVNVRLSCKPLTPITLTATHIHDYAE